MKIRPVELIGVESCGQTDREGRTDGRTGGDNKAIYLFRVCKSVHLHTFKSQHYLL